MTNFPPFVSTICYRMSVSIKTHAIAMATELSREKPRLLSSVFETAGSMKVFFLSGNLTTPISPIMLATVMAGLIFLCVSGT